MSLERKDIYDEFMKTRPSHRYDESVPLWLMVRAAQRYLIETQTADNKLPNKILARPCEFPTSQPLLRTRNEIIILYHVADPFEARLIIAECLGSVVLQYVPKKLNQPVFNEDSVLYFAQKLLELNEKMKNGAILRKFPVPAEDILATIQSLRWIYNIAEEQKTYIDNVLTLMFPKYPNINKGYGVLACELDIITDYISKNSLLLWGRETNKFHIDAHSSNAIKNGSYSKIQYYDNASNIWHISPDNAAIELEGTQNEGYDISIIRLAIAHDLGHAALPQNKSNDRADIIVEREASYFARLMLRRREWLYSGCQGGEEYNKACEKWDNLLRYIHRHDDNDLIEWVLTDDEWLDMN